tara:strand:+ start:318 stop:734 length:417 start_codon:yes stop_codon:yes gene_type:complete
MENTSEMMAKSAEMLAAVMLLSDFDICQRLANLEGLLTYEQRQSVRINVPDGDDYYFNPLEDNDQMVALMIKYDVVRTFQQYDFVGWSYHVIDGHNPAHITERQDFNGTGKPDISMAKAVCLAIILNKDDDFSLTKGE